MTIRVRTPAGFNFWRTVYSHGWCALPPFSADAETKCLSGVFDLGKSTPVRCTLRGRNGRVEIRIENGKVSDAERSLLVDQISVSLRLNERLDGFYRKVRKHEQYRWISRAGAGRMLRAPTMFEDVVKMICTTNCTWVLTTLMVTNLVKAFGRTGSDGSQSFPRPQAIASSSERFLRNNVKAGYRSPYILAFAREVASGKTDVEAWRSSKASTEELFQEMRMVKGIGPYAAGNLLKLCGRYDYLGLDSWVRGKYYEKYTRGRRVSDKAIERRYEKYGPWRGLIFWLEMTRHFYDDKFSF